MSDIWSQSKNLTRGGDGGAGLLLLFDQTSISNSQYASHLLTRSDDNTKHGVAIVRGLSHSSRICKNLLIYIF